MKKVVIAISIILLMTTGCSVKKVKELSDSEKFAKEYNISKKNVFVYTKYDDIDKVLKGTGIIFFANPDYEGCIKAASYLNEVSKKEDITNIYYYNPKTLKDKNNKKYKALTKYFKEQLEDDKYKFSLPMIVSIKDGKIINYSDELSKEDDLSEEVLTKKKIAKIKENYRKIINYEEETKEI